MNNFQKIFIAAALFGTTIPAFAVGKTHSFNSGWKFSLESDSTCIVPQFDDSGGAALRCLTIGASNILSIRISPQVTMEVIYRQV